MTAAPQNIHGTAIAVGKRGLLFVGPSGIGKSMMAFNCLSMARRQGAYCALIADDRVLLTQSMSKIVASCPPTIAGMIELRGSGIVHIEHVESFTLDLAVRVVSLADVDRLPPDEEHLNLLEIGALPMVRIANTVTDPLAVISALRPAWRSELPF